MARLVLAVLLFAWALPARAEGQPGRFDYWVLALSWSPAWCAARADRATESQCLRGLGFVVHGLWPQYADGGYPASCAKAAPVPDAIQAEMLALMPSRALIGHQWRKHGTCAGGDAASYFGQVRAASDRVRRPGKLDGRTAAQVERAFAAANPGLTPQAIAMICKGNRITEVRVCLGRDLSFRACGPRVEDRCDPSAVLAPAE